MPRRHSLRLLIASILGAVAMAALTGCQSIGPKKLVDTHQGYNDAVQLAVSREMLLNIVRMRYLEVPDFLTVSSVIAGYTYEGGIGIVLGNRDRVGVNG